MGAEPFLIASTLSAIVAQRLVRKLCEDCKIEYKLSEKELKIFEESFDLKTILERLKKDPSLKGLIKEKGDWKDMTFFKPGKCDQCDNEGYHGRTGIYEVLEVDEDMEEMVSRKATSEEIENKAKEKGMFTMTEDGIIKAIKGITSLVEIIRVTKE